VDWRLALPTDEAAPSSPTERSVVKDAFCDEASCNVTTRAPTGRGNNARDRSTDLMAAAPAAQHEISNG